MRRRWGLFIASVTWAIEPNRNPGQTRRQNRPGIHVQRKIRSSATRGRSHQMLAPLFLLLFAANLQSTVSSSTSPDFSNGVVHRAPGSEKIVLYQGFVSGPGGDPMPTECSADLFG